MMGQVVCGYYDHKNSHGTSLILQICQIVITHYL